MLKQALFLGSCLLLGGSYLHAANTIGAVAASPTAASAGVATNITFTAVVASPSVIASTVNLQQINSTGQATVIGAMYDDGTHGDAVAHDGVYSLQFPLFQQTPGSLNYRVSAGFQGSLTRALSALVTVNVTGSGTAITINSPAQSAYLNISPTTVTGTVSDPQAAVTVNGITAQVSGNSFSATVPLREGSNPITAVAQNTNGMSSTASEQVTLDTTPPHVTISAPADGAMTTDSSINVSGIVNDIVVGTVNPQQASVSVNGVPATVANRSYLASSIPLQLGANTITATARDRAGNFANVSVTVTRVAPTGQPSLTIVSGSGLTGPIQSLLAAPLVVQASNAAGQPIANTPVVFQVVSGDGTVSTGGPPGMGSIAVNTNAQGQAQVNYILGTHAGAGNNQVKASATGIATTPVFTESATTAAPALIVIDSGGNQNGVVGQALPLPFIAIVTDSGHNRLADVPVSFTVAQGGGSFNGQATLITTTDSDGRAQAVLTLGPQGGTNNNVVNASFSGNAGLPASFTATAFVPGPPQNTAISGVVLDNSGLAIPGASIRVYQVNNGGTGVPQQIGTTVQTTAQGTFFIQPAPVGVYKLMIDGTTATRPGPFPTLEYDIVTVAGQNNTVGLPIYLPQLLPGNQLCVSPTQGGTLTIPQAPGFALNIAAGSAMFPGGSRTGCVSVTPVNMDKVPMVPGFGQQPRFIVTIQPVGTTFNPPAQITIPNVDGLAPRAVTEMYSYDHDLASFVAIGTGTVSVDGSVIASDPGVGVLKAGWHCGGNPNSTGGVQNTTVSLSKASIKLAVGGHLDVTATGAPSPGFNPAYSWTSADSTIATAPFAPGNNSQSQPNVARITGVAPGTTTITVTYKCQSGQPATAQLMVKVINADSIQTSLPSTKNAVSGTAPADGMFTSVNQTKDYGDVPDLMGVLKNAGTLTSKAINVMPAGSEGDLSWEIDRNPADTVAGGVPALSAMAGVQTTFTPSLAGNFRLVLYVDSNQNGMFDDGEQVRILRMGIVQSAAQPGSFISTGVTFTGGANRADTATTMNIQLDSLLQGGGADQMIGVSKIQMGEVGNALADTFLVNYPVPVPPPVAPGNVAGTGTEIIGAPVPAVDKNPGTPCVGFMPSGGSTPFRGHSNSAMTGAGPGGNGQIVRVTSSDAPAFIWSNLHPTTTNVWGTTQGANAFREWVVAYSSDFLRNYETMGTGDWTVNAIGTRTMGVWTDNGSSVTIPGAVMGSAGLTTAGYPKTADSAGTQVLGLSFVCETSVVYAP